MAAFTPFEREKTEMFKLAGLGVVQIETLGGRTFFLVGALYIPDFFHIRQAVDEVMYACTE